MNIRPLGDRVLVEPIEEKEQTVGGIIIPDSAKEKPMQGHPEIHFNLSHCREAALCCVSDRPVGVDVEAVRPLRDGLVEYTMNDAEIAEIREAAEPALAFTLLWTMKEALLKLTGEGINNHLKEVLRRDDVVFETTAGPNARYIYSICRFKVWPVYGQ